MTTKGSHKRRAISDAEVQAALKWSSSRAEAADYLGIHRSTLYRWLREAAPAQGAAECAREARLRQYVELQSALERDPDVRHAWRPVSAYLRAIGHGTGSDAIGDPRIHERHKDDAEFRRLWGAFREVEDRAKGRIEAEGHRRTGAP